MVFMSDLRIQEDRSNCRDFTTSLLIQIKIDLAKYNDRPLMEKASTMATGINSIIVLSCSIKIFFTAGSSNHAIAAVPPATAKDKISERINLEKCFLTYELYNLSKFFFIIEKFIKC